MVTRPPYNSEWPSKIPSGDELKQHPNLQEEALGTGNGVARVYDSLLGMIGDFGRCIVGSHLAWSKIPFSEEWKPSLREKYEVFIASLTERQTQLWEEFQRIRFAGIRFIPQIDEKAAEPESPSDKEIRAAESRFLKSLRNRKRQAYDDIVVPYHMARTSQDERAMSGELVSRFIFQRVLEMGYTNELFGEFDKGYYTNRREGARIERIGKKYQWISYHEALARLSDNFYMMPDYNITGPSQYEGPWEPSLRDIAPSHILVSKSPSFYGQGHEIGWLASVDYNWILNPMSMEWRISKDDFPDTKPLIIVRDSTEGVDYYAVEAHFEWVEPHLPHEKRNQKPDRRIWYQLRSYLVAKEDCESLFQWTKEKNIYGRWMPESGDLHNIFLCEYPWAPSYIAQSSPYYGRTGWTDDAGHNTLPVEVRVTVENYNNAANDYDNSVGEGVSCHIPVPEIIEGMKLRWNPNNSHWEDNSGLCIAFDPALQGHRYQGLLVRKDMFDQYLSNSGYLLIWTVMGEKEVLGEPTTSSGKWVEYSEVYQLKDGIPLGSRNFYEKPNSSE
ncbi:MAG: hypothetical protein KAU50_12160 [Candidatus Marinimicrobia bacterium]|nr:hypothetical protein [Candidatus Neomarinimicrobiota bacterium]